MASVIVMANMANPCSCSPAEGPESQLHGVELAADDGVGEQQGGLLGLVDLRGALAHSLGLVSLGKLIERNIRFGNKTDSDKHGREPKNSEKLELLE